MIHVAFIFLSFIAYSSQPQHWSYILEIQDKHEFYQSNEDIIRPKDSWQVLYSLIYLDRNLKKLKDCVLYRVPGVEAGHLKIKTIDSLLSCEEEILSVPDWEMTNIKSLRFAIQPLSVSLDFSTKEMKSYKWTALLQKKIDRTIPSVNLSSAEFKAAKIIFLAPSSKVSSSGSIPLLKNKALCHEVNDDCSIISPSLCDLCPNGWYEVPNGCPISPKYCGVSNCGEKYRPACRRGMKWQKKESEFDCRSDSSFAFCLKGLSIVCEGRKAFCR